MKDIPFNAATADRLMAELFSLPERFNKKGLANDLLKEFIEGYPIEHLRSLLHHEDEVILSQGTWIASELAGKADVLLEDMIALSKHPSRRIRAEVLDVIALGTEGTRSEEFYRVVEGLDDPDTAVVEHALFLLCRASEGGLMAAIRHFEEAKEDRHLPGLRLLAMAQCVDPANIQAMLQGDDPLQRKYGLALAERNHATHPDFLRLASTSTDNVVRSLAEHLLRLHRIGQTPGDLSWLEPYLRDYVIMPPIIINDSPRFELPGDLGVYDSIGLAELSLEACDASDDQIHAFDSEGLLLKIVADDDGGAHLEPAETTPRHRGTLLAILRHFLIRQGEAEAVVAERTLEDLIQAARDQAPNPCSG